ncbi:NAD(P)-dependent oxidoreductase [Labrys monachus]|uniref:NADH-flavin reductase n=1 Tax=Labrys monachus TaxID=217067 RepID=A0ABU0FEQ8_9HYPH|nr:NAD(P)-dependent oxidoreductase [Labrys monachus]MDQ0393098.1 putative NADH-flavin reductase [Labrys monachus]
MKIAIIGATGNVGTRIVDEALRRSHAVTAIARDPSKLGERAGLTPVAADANVPGALAPLLAGHDAIVSSVRFSGSQPDLLIDAVRRSGVKRYLVVGGAGSLETAPGTLLIESPHFPPAYFDEASRGKAFLDILRGVSDLDWTMLSPSALFVPGERTGSFRLGDDTLLTAADGKSWISYEDFAVALIDEIEAPKHLRSRFTVGY